MDKNRDIIFLVSGRPLPVMLDMARFARSKGLNPLMIILEMEVDDLRIDYELIDFDIVIINVSYKYISWKRLFLFPKTFLQIYKIVRSQLARNGIIMSATYDLMFIACLISFVKKSRLNHQVRDLVKLQMNDGFSSVIVRFVERLMLRRIKMLAVSSMEFYNSYYRKLYNGDYVLTENVPPRDVWSGFSKSHNDTFIIGYIGIVRYKKPLYELIRATERLFEEGHDIKVKFAGGGNVDDLIARISHKNLFDFEGSFEYSRDIKNLYSEVDVIFAVYDAEDLNCKVAMPTKYYESLISKIPIMVSSDTYIGRVVDKIKTGTSVDLTIEDNMYNLLLDALNGQGWYDQAKNELNDYDIEELYQNYNLALTKCIS